MDSLTQIVLGASVGEVVCGKKIGNKALLWGAIAGTIPDLDVLLRPFQDMVQYLSYHRSFSHSFTFAILFSPLFGWLLHKIFTNSRAGFKDWTWLFFWGFVTHILLDSFTTWGTQLLFPFTNYGYALYNIFVVDPFYTIPFLIFVIATAFYNHLSLKRRKLNYIGLCVSSAYLLFSLINQQSASSAFENALKEQNIAYQSYINKATPLNIFLWSITVKTEEGYYFGYHSIFDPPNKIEFSYTPSNHQLLTNFRGNEKLERLIEITKGYYTVEKQDGEFIINDLRFGQFNGWQGDAESAFVFEYHMKAENQDKLTFFQEEYRFVPDKDYLYAYFNRIIGKKIE